MRPEDEARLERIRREATAAGLADPRHDEIGAGSFVFKTIQEVAYPAGGLKFYAARRQVVSGVDAEGQPVTLTEIPGTIYVGQLGPATIPLGTVDLAERVGGLWLTRYS